MSGNKITGVVVTGGATAASLPVTGSPVVTIAVAGVAMVVAGLLMVRAGRFDRNANSNV